MSEIDPKDLEMALSLAYDLVSYWNDCAPEQAAEDIARALTSARQSGFRMGVEKAAEVVEHEQSTRALYIGEVTGLDIALDAIRSLSPTPETQG